VNNSSDNSLSTPENNTNHTTKLDGPITGTCLNNEHDEIALRKKNAST